MDEGMFLRALRALTDRGTLLVATDSSLAALAHGLDEAGLSNAADIAEWLVDQDAVVDLLASDEEIRAALAEAGMPSMMPPSGDDDA
jgi:3-hydroxyisobutyrate dehydrogenase-like beta-hydroxyacid dehydrogenase